MRFSSSRTLARLRRQGDNRPVLVSTLSFRCRLRQRKIHIVPAQLCQLLAARAGKQQANQIRFHNRVAELADGTEPCGQLLALNGIRLCGPLWQGVFRQAGSNGLRVNEPLIFGLPTLLAYASDCLHVVFISRCTDLACCFPFDKARIFRKSQRYVIEFLTSLRAAGHRVTLFFDARGPGRRGYLQFVLCLEDFVAFEHRGFRVTADAVADELGVQWVCQAVIERTDGDKDKGAPSGIEMLIPRAKIDPLMALSALEHRARTDIDDWHARGQA